MGPNMGYFHDKNRKKFNAPAFMKISRSKTTYKMENSQPPFEINNCKSGGHLTQINIVAKLFLQGGAYLHKNISLLLASFEFLFENFNVERFALIAVKFLIDVKLPVRIIETKLPF